MSDELLHEHMDQDRERFNKLEAKLDVLTGDLRTVREDIANYKGFLGGIVFLATAIGTALGLAIGWWK